MVTGYLSIKCVFFHKTPVYSVPLLKDIDINESLRIVCNHQNSDTFHIVDDNKSIIK